MTPYGLLFILVVASAAILVITAFVSLLSGSLAKASRFCSLPPSARLYTSELSTSAPLCRRNNLSRVATRFATTIGASPLIASSATQRQSTLASTSLWAFPVEPGGAPSGKMGPLTSSSKTHKGAVTIHSPAPDDPQPRAHLSRHADHAELHDQREDEEHERDDPDDEGRGFS